ncbi:MAG: hypothetical protein CMM50_16495 [Rhodospirillaceae bacterium]|nr:hypothetical protein [Rhodospirillaceae bacterium]
MAISLDDLARRQLGDFRNLTPGTCFDGEGVDLDLDQAYGLQEAVARLRVAEGERVAGYKVGCTGPGIFALFGMRGPIRAHLFESELRPSGVELDHRNFANLAIEGEMALRVGPDGGIAAAFPIIELHNFVFRRPQKTLVELVANNGINTGVVLPEDETPWPGTSTRVGTVLGVTLNGESIETGDLWPLPGGAEESLAWLKDNLGPAGLPLREGDLVLAGTPLGLHPLKPGDHVAVTLDGAPKVECRVV